MWSDRLHISSGKNKAKKEACKVAIISHGVDNMVSLYTIRNLLARLDTIAVPYSMQRVHYILYTEFVLMLIEPKYMKSVSLKLDF